jgi:Coenzyme PQQ synthesis protein D (PqqD)
MTYRRNPAVVFHQVDDRIMMMNPDRAEFVTLSPTGAAVWHALAEPGSADDIVDRIRPDWPEADPSQMRTDIDAFLQNLEAAGAIVRQPAP